MNDIEILTQEVAELKEEFHKLRTSATIPYDIDAAFRERFKGILNLPAGFSSIPLGLITAPTGGATIDSQARSAINSLITRLEDLDLISPN